MAKKKNKTLCTPPIPIGHLTISQFEELRKAIERITGTVIYFDIIDKKTKKKIASI